MPRLSLYLFRQISLAFLFAAVTVVFVVLFTQSFRLMSFVIDNSGTMLIFFQLMSLMMFSFLPLLVPLSLGIAVVFTYHKLAIDSELVVMRSAGVSPLSLARPAIALAGVAVLLGYLLTLWLTPWANSELVNVQYRVRDNFSVFLLKSGAFNDIAEGVTFYARERGKNGELEGILIHDVRTDRPVTIMAETGQFTVDENGVPQVVVFKGKRQEINRETGRLSQLDFDRYVVDLQLTRNGASSRMPDPREQSTILLLVKVLSGGNTEDAASAANTHNSRERILAELHQRFTTPLLALSFCLIGICSILVGPFNRRGMAKRIIIAAMSIVVFQAGALSLDNLIAKHGWLAPALYLVVSAPIPVCLAILSNDRWFKLPFSLHLRAKRLIHS